MCTDLDIQWQGKTDHCLIIIIIIIIFFFFCYRSLKATAIDAGLRLHSFQSVHFDSELPHYGTKDGVHRDPKGM